MADGFKIADAFIDVTADTSKALAKVGALGGSLNSVAALSTALAQVAAGGLAFLPALIGAAGAAAVTAKLGFEGFSDALTAEDPAAYAEAVAKLAPAARDTANAFREMKPTWDGIQQNVQQNLFAGMAEPIQALGSTYLPILNTGLGGIATQMGSMGQLAVQALMTPQSVSSVNAVLGGTQGLLGGMKGSLGDVLGGFLAIAGAGSTELPALGTAIGNATAKFREWATTAAQSGQINTLITAGKQAFADLGTVLGNLGGIATGVFNAMQTAGTGTMSLLIQVTSSLSAMVNSVSGQQALVAIFQTLSVVAGQLGQVLSAITPILGPLFMLLGQVAQTVGGMLVSAVQALAPPLTVLITALQSALAPVLSNSQDLWMKIF